jgi:FimV-like protein
MREGNIMKNLFVFCLLLIGLTTMPVMAQTSEETIDSYIARGDAAEAEWNYRDAAIAYVKAIELDPNHYEANWKAGNMYTELADHLPDKQKNQKEIYFEKAREFCEKALSVKPDGWEAHFRLSVALGRLALFRGGKKKIELSKQIKEEIDKAIETHPGPDQAEELDLCYHVLGRWHQNLANLSSVLKFFAKALYGGVPPGTNEEAIAAFKKAIEIKSTHIEHHLEIARTYKYMKQKDLAREHLEKVLQLPDVEEDDPELKKEAQKMLKKL